MSPAGFPHSDTLESQLGCQLLEAYRRLLRPSSAPGAKAFTVCPYKLATQHNTTQTTRPPPESSRPIDRRTQRCSRPLCSSQATNRHQPLTHHTPTTPARARTVNSLVRDQPVRRNSKTCSLRTQQRATTHQPTH